MTKEAIAVIESFLSPRPVGGLEDVLTPISLPGSGRRLLASDKDDFVVSPIDQARRELVGRVIELQSWPHLGPAVDSFGVFAALHHDHGQWQLAIDDVWQSVPSFHLNESAVVLQAITQALSESVESAKPAQLKLPMAGDFSPSARLVEIWQTSVLAMAQEAGIKNAAISELESPQEFGKSLTSLIGSMGQEFRYAKDSRVVAISRSGKFLPSIQVTFCDRFLIVPDQSADFLSLLYTELRKSLQDGIVIRGSWGALAVDSENELIYRLAAPDFVSAPGFKKATEIR